MTPRFFVPSPAFVAGGWLSLPQSAARHVQVLRLQPGADIRVFDGQGGEWSATVESMGRNDVQVRLIEHHAIERELPCAVTLALGMPANDRMDDLVEKATELGVASIQPLVCERSVLRLSGERAEQKVARWQGVAAAACEQSGRNRVPRITPVRRLADWLGGADPLPARRYLLSLDALAPPPSTMPQFREVPLGAQNPVGLVALSGPEGGLSGVEEALAKSAGFQPLSLGARVMRADTAPLALLAWLAIGSGSPRL